jgi:alkylation response protein AidB-like acyl-CoA dehydrogenase
MNAPAPGLADLLYRLDGHATVGLPVPDDGRFPDEAMRRLTHEGVLRAVLPGAFGGFGLGTEPGRGLALLSLLHALGRIGLPLGRLVEAHVNALRIIFRYGDRDQGAAAAIAVDSGALFGLWVTDPPGDGGLRLVEEADGLRLSGGKQFCSGAGHVTHAVVTAFDPACHDRRLLLLPLDGSERVTPLAAPLAGMKAATTGQVEMTGRRLPRSALIGTPGDYLREPDFSAGAWRSSAVALGGLFQLTELVRRQLSARGRTEDPHQRVRFGEMLIAHGTGQLWLAEAGSLAEDLRAAPEEIVARVGLARTAVERACLNGIERAQRSLGLSAFLTDNAVERLMRDLQTYLRQPAADEVLNLAAGHFLRQPLPGL